MTQPSFDSFHALPYLDGGGVPTIGYGTVINAADAAGKYSKGISREDALALFQAHVDNECIALNRFPAFCLLMQHQKDAVISLAYNIGINAFIGSTIFQRIKGGMTDLQPWLLFVRDAKGVTEPGLVTRRIKELRLFIYGAYS
jgi:lysozyme